MIDDLNDYLMGIVIGIRFQPNFVIDDKFGYIADTLLYSEKSLFNSEVFPTVTIAQPPQLILNHEQLKDRMLFDKSNVILDINFDEGSPFTKNDIPKIVDAFDNQIIKGVIKDLLISRIMRIGFIRKYLFLDNQLIKSFLSQIANDKDQNISEFDLRFTRKYSAGESLTKNEKNDFKNAIVTLSKKADSETGIEISLDYQRFYYPYLSSYSLIKFNQFFQEAESYNSKTFTTWLSNFLEK